ncbi:hypothetical protein SAMN05216436_1022 [bacterium A37T11]|nr:hypothetical protein SAMN05216436_1022 [bacterium A37T11]
MVPQRCLIGGEGNNDYSWGINMSGGIWGDSVGPLGNDAFCNSSGLGMADDVLSGLWNTQNGGYWIASEGFNGFASEADGF